MGGAEEAKTGRGFWGTSGRELRKALRMGGFHVDSAWPTDRRVSPEQETVAFTNTIIHHANNSNIFPGVEYARACLSQCQASLNGSDGHPWLACGANAVETLTGFRFLKFTDIRGTFLPVSGRPDKWLVATIHPAFIVRGGKEDNPNAEQGKAQMALFPFLALDARRATQTQTPWVPTVHSGIPSILPDSSDLPALDIEGGYNAPISLVGISWEPNVAWVMPWGPDSKAYVKKVLERCTPIFHNAAYDIPALETEGITVSRGWLDTINTAALLNPSVKVGLEAQVLSYIPGSVAWKGLIDHKHGPDYEGPTQKIYRKLHTKILHHLGLPVPTNGTEWFIHYNGLDTAGTRLLLPAHKRELEAQGRAGYYRDIMQPLQEPLLRMGLRGMPVDLNRMTHHRKACERLERMASRILNEATFVLRLEKKVVLRDIITNLEGQRQLEKDVPESTLAPRKFSKAKQLTSVRTSYRAVEKADSFNGNSPQQRIGLLAWLGLPYVTHHKTGRLTSDEKAITSLVMRLQKGTIKSKAEKEYTLRVLKALLAISKWSSWRETFLTRKAEA